MKSLHSRWAYLQYNNNHTAASKFKIASTKSSTILHNHPPLSITSYHRPVSSFFQAVLVTRPQISATCPTTAALRALHAAHSMPHTTPKPINSSRHRRLRPLDVALHLVYYSRLSQKKSRPAYSLRPSRFPLESVQEQTCRRCGLRLLSVRLQGRTYYSSCPVFSVVCRFNFTVRRPSSSLSFYLLLSSALAIINLLLLLSNCGPFLRAPWVRNIHSILAWALPLLGSCFDHPVRQRIDAPFCRVHSISQISFYNGRNI